VHPTLGIRRRSQAFFYASAFFQSDGVPPPAPARVTQTVRWLLVKNKIDWQFVFDEVGEVLFIIGFFELLLATVVFFGLLCGVFPL